MLLVLHAPATVTLTYVVVQTPIVAAPSASRCTASPIPAEASTLTTSAATTASVVRAAPLCCKADGPTTSVVPVRIVVASLLRAGVRLIRSATGSKRW